MGEFTQFILNHENDDVTRLLLGASKYPDIDIKKAVIIINARKKIKSKIPSWYQIPSLKYPQSLSVEQCSSESTARYKAKILNHIFTKSNIQGNVNTDSSLVVKPAEQLRIADITGGLGVDSYFFSQEAEKVFYFERDQELTDTARHNFNELNITNISVKSTDIQKDNLNTLERLNINAIYLDPARRGNHGEKVYSIKDCEPNILELKDELFKIVQIIMVKISPMADISKTIELLPETRRVDIISSGNECKEVLLTLIKKTKTLENQIKIHAVNIYKNDTQDFVFSPDEEKITNPSIVTLEDINQFSYLYEPNKSILKAGAFKLPAIRYDIKKIAINTHLYLSSDIKENFPGKCFKILKVLEYKKATIKLIKSDYPNASITARNFPLSSDNLRKKLKLNESNKYHIFACSLDDASKWIFITERI
ncbi:MAG: SAM-dependent methyltransferase [Bacteroidales bacterium]